MLGKRALLCVSAALVPQAALAADDIQSGLDEIVVTAQKREQNLNDVPISISVAGSAAIEAARAQDLRDISRLVPNFSVQRQGGLDTVFIRGIGGGGRNIGMSGRAGVYVDGVYAGQFASVNQDTLSVDRVEVLRGPQGQLFGRNTVSGAVNIVTQKPSDAFSGHVEAGYGNMDLFEISGALNLPLADGVAVRLAGAHRERDGFVRNDVTGTDIDNVNRDSLRGQLHARLGDRLTFDLAADYSRDKANKLLGEPLNDVFGLNPPSLGTDYDVSFNDDPFQDIKVGGVSGTFTHELSDSAELVSISGYRETRWKRRNDLDYIPLDLFVFDFNDRFSQFSQEVRVSFGKGGPLSGVAGVYYFDETAKTHRGVTAGSQVEILPYGFVPGDQAWVKAEIHSQSIAGFASVDWAAAERLTVNLGARYTHERRKLVDYSSLGQAVINVATIPGYSDKRSSDSLDPTIGITYAVSDQANLYAKYARGFKTGGWNIDFISPQVFTDALRFGDETVNAFEAGVKGESADKRVRYALAGFYAIYDDYQIDQFVDLGGGQVSIQLRNAAKVSSWGAEASVEAAPVTGMLVNAGLGYANASFDRFRNGGGPGIDLDGNRAPYAPRLTATAGARYEVPADFVGGTLGFGVNWNYRSKSYRGPENTADQLIDARHLVDARIELAGQDRRWSVALWGRNLFNDRYVDNRIFDFFATHAVEYGEPRTYGVSARIGL